MTKKNTKDTDANTFAKKNKKETDANSFAKKYKKIIGANIFDNMYGEKQLKRHLMVWKLASTLLDLPMRYMLNFSYEVPDFSKMQGPALVIANHANALDTIMMGVIFRKHHMYYVANENMARVPVFGPALMHFFAPVTRKKGTTDLEMVKTVVKLMKAGHSICIFAEGEQSWDGVTAPIFKGTGKLLKLTSANLITYRFEGAYLSLPRWGKVLKRGRIIGKVAGIYTSEELAKTSPDEILDLMSKDLYFNIWDWQRNQPKGPVKYKSIGIGGRKDYAKGIDRLFFMCPECGSFGTLKTSRDQIYCDCNSGGRGACRFRARFLKTGFIEPIIYNGKEDISTILDWDRIQREALVRKVKELMESGADEILFCDDNARLLRVYKDYKDERIDEGSLSLSFSGGESILSAGGHSFKMREISDLALMLSRVILFTVGKEYYQINAKDTNTRKYLLVWQLIKKKD